MYTFMVNPRLNVVVIEKKYPNIKHVRENSPLTKSKV